MDTLQQPLHVTAHQLSEMTGEQFGDVSLLLSMALDNIHDHTASDKHLITISGKRILEREQHAPVISAALWHATQPNVANATELAKELNKL